MLKKKKKKKNCSDRIVLISKIVTGIWGEDDGESK